jgi:RNA polymerase primary sigma factor
MLIENTINTTIQTGVDSLNGRRKQILTMYFGLDGEEPKTLQAIGDIIGVTRERVRQLKEMAMDDLKQEINYEELAAPVI